MCRPSVKLLPLVLTKGAGRRELDGERGGAVGERIAHGAHRPLFCRAANVVVTLVCLCPQSDGAPPSPGRASPGDGKDGNPSKYEMVEARHFNSLVSPFPIALAAVSTALSCPGAGVQAPFGVQVLAVPYSRRRGVLVSARAACGAEAHPGLDLVQDPGASG